MKLQNINRNQRFKYVILIKILHYYGVQLLDFFDKACLIVAYNLILVMEMPRVDSIKKIDSRI